MFHMTFDFGFGYFWQLAFGARDKTIVDNAIKTSLKYPKGAQPAQVIGCTTCRAHGNTRRASRGGRAMPRSFR